MLWFLLESIRTLEVFNLVMHQINIAWNEWIYYELLIEYEYIIQEYTLIIQVNVEVQNMGLFLHD